MNISGRAECSLAQMVSLLLSVNPDAKSFADEYAKLYLEEGEAENIRGDIAWAQSLIETHYFKFDNNTAVTFDQNNFCGHGVLKKGMKGNSFESPRIGIRVQIQHLKAYANTLPLANPCVDTRFKYVTRGKANDSVEGLSGTWASDKTYGSQIITMVNKIKSTVVNEEKEDNKMVPIKQKLANKSNYGASRNLTSIKYIVMHATGNDGDTDENNGKYFANNVVKASAHFFVDDDSITQSVPVNYVAYSVGGLFKISGSAGRLYGKCTNANSISVELCDTVKNGVVYPTAKTIANALELVKQLQKEYNIPNDCVIRHFDVNGKNCPVYWTNDSTWRADFWNKLQTAQAVTTPTTAPTVTTTSEFKVKILSDELNYRSGPGTSYAIKGVVKKNQVYTIVSVSGNWGKLKSGAGWINISAKYVKRV